MTTDLRRGGGNLRIESRREFRDLRARNRLHTIGRRLMSKVTPSCANAIASRISLLSGLEEHRKGDDPAMFQHLENTIHTLWSPLKLKKLQKCYKYIYHALNVILRNVHVVAACS